MNKTEFINAVAEKAQFTKADTKKVVEAFIEVVSSEMKDGGKIVIPGFGVFSISEKAERKGVNPQTKQEIVIAAHKIVKFKPGSELAKIVK
ncbi:MAG: HU family DNA-binding protein [Tannerellaceae bacterium]|jgi:DNA-binding protein HU-beta|nr:HU family DNA-binding protein [Tannerellaceae bacterium]